MKINIYLNQLEPGRHIARKTISSARVTVVEVPEEECSEIRPDWGVYHPVVTHTKVEKRLHQLGLAPDCGVNESWSFSIARGED